MLIDLRRRARAITPGADWRASIVDLRLRLGRNTSFAMSIVLALASVACCDEIVTGGQGWASNVVLPVLIAVNLILSFGGYFRRYRATPREIGQPPAPSSGRPS
jgi:hypothetical protein